MTVKYFNVKNGVTAGPITLDANTGNITGTNLTVTGKSNLGNVGNVTINGGGSGFVLKTDGAGNLSFVNPVDTQSPAPMPTYVGANTTLTISANYQGLFGYPITIDGTMDVEGILVDVNDATVPSGPVGSVQFNQGDNIVGGDANLTYVPGTATLTASKIVTTSSIRTTPVIVSNLPSAITAGAGARAFVTDSTTKIFADRVFGGGANAVPVYSDGSNWFVG